MTPGELPELELSLTATEPQESTASEALAVRPPGLSINPAALSPALLGLPLGVPLPVQVPAQYAHGRFGAQAQVTLAGEDAQILTEMSQLAALCHVMAGKMNRFQGVMSSTRTLIKSLRVMAADLQDEIELRRGPQ